MRAIKAKSLRRIAEGATPGAPLVTYYLRKTHRDQLRLHPSCTRSVYKQLKKAEKEAKHV